MQVILQEDHPGLGFVGDLVNVKQGFARNFLFPQKIALPASKGAVKLLEHRKRQLAVKKAQKKKEAEAYKAKLNGVSLRIQHAAEGDRLFGSVTLTEIHEELKKGGVEIDRKLLKIEGPIKTIGEHIVAVRLHPEVLAEIKLHVEKKVEEVTEERAAKPKAEKKVSKKKEKAADSEESAEANADGE